MKERDLPLTALRAFATAARSENLMAAARQLGVTHGAVSKQIAVLEAQLGQELFVREGRSLRLSPYGQVLAERVTQSMRDLVAACDHVRRDRERRVISVEAPTTFAMYFLLPAIKQFEQDHPGYAVWVSTRTTNQVPDFGRHDIVITRGPGLQKGARIAHTYCLFEEALTVVCSGLSLHERPMAQPADISGHALIASASRPGDWDSWFAQAGVEGHRLLGGHVFDHLFVAMHAVRDNLGATVAPKQFVAHLDRDYGLVCPFPDIAFPGKSCIANVTTAADRSGADRLLQWLSARSR
ncbi:LysR substrate-binding domain-containing protein [Sphingomonas sp. BK235]|uniref:LysR substrate-binding domain-containing protein n=1 Tax=Sphingomonas sp. BK235 TaxID=2512131 RepID=UPI00104EE2B5|nr:LysR substrate-binding domain-containing protein [Sphingomonas sp. BK235]TCP33240.1 LysR family transcriptional regulator [Sphingomonas sp. BK235]